ncbi:MAG: VOC family protein, partial [Bacteroidetes bacterium]
MKKVIISGIQQVGVGIPDVYAAWKWFRQHFGMDIPVFEEAAEANLMLPYTNGKPWKRHAILAANLQGGGGMEIWQYTGRTPQPPAFEVQVGDLGIYTARIKARNIEAAFAFMKGKQADIPADLCKDPAGNAYFWVMDRYQNLFQVVTNESWFANTRAVTGGVSGCM